jgi:hypothetical protein
MSGAAFDVGRREVILGALTGAVLPPVLARASSARPSTGVAFDVVRKGSVIGQHLVSFERRGNLLLAKIDVRMRIGFGPITLFRYSHEGTEVWDSGRFSSIETRTDNNGEALSVSARRVGDFVEVRTGGVARKLPPGTCPLTHWNVTCMGAPTFNPQDGKTVEVMAQRVGADAVDLENGTRIPATRWHFGGHVRIDDWYAADGTWTALEATVADGSVLRYRARPITG